MLPIVELLSRGCGSERSLWPSRLLICQLLLILEYAKPDPDRSDPRMAPVGIWLSVVESPGTELLKNEDRKQWESHENNAPPERISAVLLGSYWALKSLDFNFTDREKSDYYIMPKHLRSEISLVCFPRLPCFTILSRAFALSSRLLTLVSCNSSCKLALLSLPPEPALALASTRGGQQQPSD